MLYEYKPIWYLKSEVPNPRAVDLFQASEHLILDYEERFGKMKLNNSCLT